MKKNICSINQPYFFPYIGFFSLLAKSDVFIFLDDVNMRKKGFIHRNYLIDNKQKWQFTVPIIKLSQNVLIKDTLIQNYSVFFDNFYLRIKESYKKEKHYHQLESVLENISNITPRSISELASYSIRLVCTELNIQPEFLYSSNFKVNNFAGQEKILELCKAVNTKKYLNLPSGKHLYDKERFEKEAIELGFQSINEHMYSKFYHYDKTPLSILDTISRFSFCEISKFIRTDTNTQ